MAEAHPSLDEVALGAFLEDIGKFMQRAHRSRRDMPQSVLARESDVLPPDRHGGYSHLHALWTDAFFDWMETETLAWPDGIHGGRVRDAAVYHHHPRTPLHWLSAVADRLSAGMDRKAKDEAAEAEQDDKAWDAFRRVPLDCLFDRINLGRGAPAKGATYDVTELTATAMFPANPDRNRLPETYTVLWQSFLAGFAALCRTATNVAQFHEGLLSLSERFTWAIPSSTIDQPDVSLHDHNRTVAAFAACLYRHHEARGELDDEAAIRDRERRKFRVLIGDLSGIQASLFRLKSEGVRGVNRILRARSFSFGQIGEAAALLCRERLALPPYCLLQGAGGRFHLLVPEVDSVEDSVQALRAEIDDWMLGRYQGDLVLNLALGPPLSGNDFRVERFADTSLAIAAAVDEAKQRPLVTRLVAPGPLAADPVLRIDYRAEGSCPTCGVRPVPADEPADRLDGIARCPACAAEAERGRVLPKAVAAVCRAGSGSDAVFGRFIQEVRSEPLDPRHDSAQRRQVLSGWRLRGLGDAGSFPFADRFVANHVPLMRAGDGDHGRYDGLAEDEDDATVGVDDAKTFAHLAADAREWDERREVLVGRAMLSVIKADVDRLGFVFGHGLGNSTSVGRTAQLSRMVDAFFTGYLDHLLESDDFRNTYTVYSGGDDLLLIAPWLTGIRLVQRLRVEFGRFVNGNPNITLSAGVEFIAVNEPLNRAVRRAEERLERAKHDGRDRVSLVADEASVPWVGGDGSLAWALERAEWLNALIRSEVLPATFLYTMLALDRQRRRFEADKHPTSANWRSRWGYHLARLRGRLPRERAAEIGRGLDMLMGGNLLGCSAAGGRTLAVPSPDPSIPITIALYRNR